jgi:two-component system, LytTR family, response regulator
MTTEKIHAILVDDEELARDVLRELLATHPEIELVAECANGFAAVKAIGELKPDLLFLDIQMPKLDGFEVLELTGTDMAIVFTTAYDEYAVRAFEVHAADYLLKPFGAERFEIALEQAKKRIGAPHTPLADLASSAHAPGEYVNRIVVRDGTNIHIIPSAKLDYAESQDDYIAIFSEGRKHLKQQTIASLEAALDPSRFLRIHRSYIVNLERVTKVEPYGKESRLAILRDGTRLPVSRSGYSRLCRALGES